MNTGNKPVNGMNLNVNDTFRETIFHKVIHVSTGITAIHQLLIKENLDVGKGSPGECILLSKFTISLIFRA